jgi:hypothetical protein
MAYVQSAVRMESHTLGQRPSISSILQVKQQTYFMGKLSSSGPMVISRWQLVQVQT